MEKEWNRSSWQHRSRVPAYWIKVLKTWTFLYFWFTETWSKWSWTYCICFEPITWIWAGNLVARISITVSWWVGDTGWKKNTLHYDNHIFWTLQNPHSLKWNYPQLCIWMAISGKTRILQNHLGLSPSLCNYCQKWLYTWPLNNLTLMFQISLSLFQVFLETLICFPSTIPSN